MRVSDQFIKDRKALQELQSAGVPVFTCVLRRSHQGKESGFPKGWTSTSPSDYDLCRAEPGSAFCVVTGHVVDVIDVDPRNDGDPDAVREILMDSEAPVLASVETPGGGAHFYLPSTGLSPQMPPGIDYLAEGQMAFAPPSQRPKYPGEWYRWTATPNLGHVGKASPHARAAVLALAAVQSRHTPHPTSSESNLIIEIRDLDYADLWVMPTSTPMALPGGDSGLARSA